MGVENAPGWDELTDHDKAEVKRFETFLRAHYAAKEGKALDAPELLYECVYGPTKPEDDNG